MKIVFFLCEVIVYNKTRIILKKILDGIIKILDISFELEIREILIILKEFLGGYF